MIHDPEPAGLPSLPVAIPSAVVELPRVEPDSDDDDNDRERDDPLDWRIGVGAVGFVWAAFSSLMLSVAPPAAGTIAAWLLVTAGAGAWSLRHWRDALQGRSPPAALLASTTVRQGGSGDEGP